jgi:hypothetical protein
MIRSWSLAEKLRITAWLVIKESWVLVVWIDHRDMSKKMCKNIVKTRIQQHIYTKVRRPVPFVLYYNICYLLHNIHFHLIFQNKQSLMIMYKITT